RSLGEPPRDRDARLRDLLRERPLHLRGLAPRRRRERGACTLDAAFGVLRELGRVLPEERVVVLERHHDAPERVVVAQAERVAQAVEALPLLVGGVSTDDLRELFLETHGTTPARTLRRNGFRDQQAHLAGCGGEGAPHRQPRGAREVARGGPAARGWGSTT